MREAAVLEDPVGPPAGLGQGALFAVHDDRGLSAFAWDDIARTLRLRSGCRNR